MAFVALSSAYLKFQGLKTGKTYGPYAISNAAAVGPVTWNGINTFWIPPEPVQLVDAICDAAGANASDYLALMADGFPTANRAGLPALDDGISPRAVPAWKIRAGTMLQIYHHSA